MDVLARNTGHDPIDKAAINNFCLKVADQVTAMLAYWDKNQICRFANEVYIEWFGRTREEMIDKITMKELLGPLYSKNLPYIKKALKGEKQIFERDIPIPSGETRHTLATYYPDIVNGEVRGFFVHVADITPIKKLEAKLLKKEQENKREVLRSVIETQEREREAIVHTLRNNINQTLSSCKLMLENVKQNIHDPLLDKTANSITQAIDKLKSICVDLNPSVITDIGLKDGIKEYLQSFEKSHPIKVQLKFSKERTNGLSNGDKISIFRILQNALIIASRNNKIKSVFIELAIRQGEVIYKVTHDVSGSYWKEESIEFKDIQNRVAYYNGSLATTTTNTGETLEINLRF